MASERDTAVTEEINRIMNEKLIMDAIKNMGESEAPPRQAIKNPSASQVSVAAKASDDVCKPGQQGGACGPAQPAPSFIRGLLPKLPTFKGELMSIVRTSLIAVIAFLIMSAPPSITIMDGVFQRFGATCCDNVGLALRSLIFMVLYIVGTRVIKMTGY